jgi:hypothetical protein
VRIPVSEYPTFLLLLVKPIYLIVIKDESLCSMYRDNMGSVERLYMPIIWRMNAFTIVLIRLHIVVMA